jgi:hypothetical protein
MRCSLVLACLLAGCAGRTSPSSPPLPPAIASSAGPQGPAPRSATRWAPATCRLRYEILTVERFATEAKSPMELRTFVTVDTTTTTANTIDLSVRGTSWIRSGKHWPYAIADTGFPSVSITTDGSAWRATQPSPLLAGLGSQGGLAWLFPSLPGPSASSRVWDLPFEPRVLNANGVSFLNSRGPAISNARAVIAFPLRQEASTASDGTLMIRAHGPERWSSRVNADDIAVLERLGDIRTEHVVLPSGRLLRAHLERDVTLTFTVEGKPMTSRFSQRSEAHLVSACDGPTEATLEPVPTREERAITALGELGVVLGQDRRASAPAAFSERLRRVHGDKAILATLERFRTGRGSWHWWPLPILLMGDDEVVVHDDRVDVSLTTSLPSPTSANTMTPALFRFELVESAGRFYVDRVTAAFTLEPGNAKLLEISRDRLVP